MFVNYQGIISILLALTRFQSGSSTLRGIGMPSFFSLLGVRFGRDSQRLLAKRKSQMDLIGATRHKMWRCLWGAKIWTTFRPEFSCSSLLTLETVSTDRNNCWRVKLWGSEACENCCGSKIKMIPQCGRFTGDNSRKSIAIYPSLDR